MAYVYGARRASWFLFAEFRDVSSSEFMGLSFGDACDFCGRLRCLWVVFNGLVVLGLGGEGLKLLS